MNSNTVVVTFTIHLHRRHHSVRCFTSPFLVHLSRGFTCPIFINASECLLFFLFLIVGVLVANFVIDIAYVFIDPRTRVGMQGGP